MFQLQERVENKSSQASEWEKQTDNLRRELSDKTHRLQQTEQTLAYAREVLWEFVGLKNELNFITGTKLLSSDIKAFNISN